MQGWGHSRPLCPAPVPGGELTARDPSHRHSPQEARPWGPHQGRASLFGWLTRVLCSPQTAASGARPRGEAPSAPPAQGLGHRMCAVNTATSMGGPRASQVLWTCPHGGPPRSSVRGPWLRSEPGSQERSRNSWWGHGDPGGCNQPTSVPPPPRPGFPPPPLWSPAPVPPPPPLVLSPPHW